MEAPGPVEALERIAYLLERDLEDSYRVKAFRRAAGVLAGMGPSEVVALARRGRLADLPGIGDRTAAVVTEALSGQVPAYLAELEARPGVEAGGAAAQALRAALRGDCHSHSDWSDGGSPILAMALAARALGHEYLVLTDHSPSLKVANGLSAERLAAQLEAVAGLAEHLAPFRLLSGIEVDILEDGSLDQDPSLLERLDVVVGSVHSKLRMDAGPMTRRMVRALSNPLLDILGHCTGRLLTGGQGGRGGRQPSTFDTGEVFGAAAELGKAIEVNSRPERLDPPRALLAQALEAGCLLAIDTDAHAPGQLEWQPLGCARVVACGGSPSVVVNAWGADQLLEWASGHRLFSASQAAHE